VGRRRGAGGRDPRRRQRRRGERDADRTLDDTFGDHGIVTTDLGTTSDLARAMAVQPSGAIVLAGTDGARYTEDGQLDSGVLEDVVTTDVHGKGEFGQDIAVQADGKLVAAGFTANGFDTEFALIRVNP
jgi:hypothetical protein